ncbi:MAG: DUF1273 family protein [Ruminiclostridium sp.]|nr:DUF1273 family protein [Ruminiclostridium sp.]
MKDVSFTGHRHIDTNKYRPILTQTLEELILDGSDMFYAGGAMGFDTLAAQTVIELKASYPWITLVLLLPCPPEEQASRFTEYQRDEYYEILRNADRSVTISPHYAADCMKKRNMELINRAEICVCCYNESLFKSGTGQTVRMAVNKGIQVINLYKE